MSSMAGLQTEKQRNRGSYSGNLCKGDGSAGPERIRIGLESDRTQQEFGK
jgi:hypothetical protein